MIMAESSMVTSIAVGCEVMVVVGMEEVVIRKVVVRKTVVMKVVVMKVVVVKG